MTERGFLHYRDEMPPETVMDTIEGISGRFEELGMGDLRSVREMERLGRDLIGYADELEESWKVRRIEGEYRDRLNSLGDLATAKRILRRLLLGGEESTQVSDAEWERIESVIDTGNEEIIRRRIADVSAPLREEGDIDRAYREYLDACGKIDAAERHLADPGNWTSLAACGGPDVVHGWFMAGVPVKAEEEVRREAA